MQSKPKAGDVYYAVKLGRYSHRFTVQRCVWVDSMLDQLFFERGNYFSEFETALKQLKNQTIRELLLNNTSAVGIDGVITNRRKYYGNIQKFRRA